jgi:hypothetical protein
MEPEAQVAALYRMQREKRPTKICDGGARRAGAKPGGNPHRAGLPDSPQRLKREELLVRYFAEILPLYSYASFTGEYVLL